MKTYRRVIRLLFDLIRCSVVHVSEFVIFFLELLYYLILDYSHEEMLNTLRIYKNHFKFYLFEINLAWANFRPK